MNTNKLGALFHNKAPNSESSGLCCNRQNLYCYYSLPALKRKPFVIAVFGVASPSITINYEGVTIC